MTELLMCMLGLFLAQATAPHAKAHIKSASEQFYAKQEPLFEKANKELVKMGRIPPGGSGFRESFLGRFSWHYGDSVSFGAYTFYPPAFEQAKRTWEINGFMLAGSDLLWVTSDAKFDKSVIGRSIDFMYEAGCYKDDDNTPCEPELKSQQRQLRDARILDVFGHTYEWHSWGTGGESKGPEYWEGPLKLDKKAPAFVRQWHIVLKPEGWVDMCACTMPVTTTKTADKECVQGQTLAPGESCSMSVSIR